MSYCSAILLAAGRSRRLGFDKILTPLAGKIVLKFSFEVLLNSDDVDEIVVVTRGDIREKIQALVDEYKVSKAVRVIEGGKERQDSVWEGISVASDQATEVLIHDAARPLITQETITMVLAEARRTGAAIVGKPASDTVKKSNESDEIVETVERSSVWLVETPQIFKKELIKEAYEHVKNNKLQITDDASAVELLNHKVQLIESKALNLKLTRPEDWRYLELLFQSEKGKKLRGLVHQLSNELSPIVGYMPLIEKQLGENPKAKGYFQKVQSASGHVQKTVNEIQDNVRELFPD